MDRQDKPCTDPLATTRDRFKQQHLASALQLSCTRCFVEVLLEIDFPFLRQIIVSFLYNILVDSLHADAATYVIESALQSGS